MYIKPHVNVDHDIHELIEKRWSTRAFSDRPIEDEVVMRLFEAARWAASANNEQPWRFIYAHRGDSEKFSKILSCLNAKNQEWARYAGVLVITVVKTFFDYNHKNNKWAFHDLGLSIGNLSMQATHEGLYVHNMGGISPEKVREEFDIPEGFEPLTGIAIGYMGSDENLSDEMKGREHEMRERLGVEDLFVLK